ncbi:HutD family protein [Pseudarthrobacter sp. WHRI 8279]|uniref:HutD/Ves family protein n=1 Tax=Pseudarthrobacter sp. WHRI 8279 TaxID=3162566 RepID=UPI0032EDEC1E
MEIIRFADLKPEPWRNGGGVTREIAGNSGAGSGPGTGHNGGWDWRVSIAEVSKAGDFSPFPGMERVLTVVEGELLLLTVDGAEHPLEKYRAFRFSGEASTTCALPTGDVRNLNVITRAGKFKGFTSIIELSKKRAHPLFAGQLGVLLQGQATATDGAEAGTATGTEGPGPVALDRYDTVVGSDSGSPEILGRGFLAVVSIDEVTG